jgi:hypothetical protein
VPRRVDSSAAGKAQAVKVARKPHMCAYCGKTILHGEPMELISTQYYGLAVTHPQCKPPWIRDQRRVQARAR